MKKKKYLLLILAVFSICFTVSTINETYAKYVSSARSTTLTSIARWKIVVNENDISLGASTTNFITPVFPGSDHIKEGVIAPNVEGYFDLVLDATNVDVSFNYKINIVQSETNPVKELVATRYTINNGEAVLFQNGIQEINETILFTSVDRIANIRVYVKWDDSLNLMNNSEDTDTTINNQKGMIEVVVSAIQIE